MDARTMPSTNPNSALLLGFGATCTARLGLATFTCCGPPAVRLDSSWLILVLRFACWMMLSVLGDAVLVVLPFDELDLGALAAFATSSLRSWRRLIAICLSIARWRLAVTRLMNTCAVRLATSAACLALLDSTEIVMKVVFSMAFAFTVLTFAILPLCSLASCW